MPGRQFVGATGYAYGFGGQLKDDEISGNSNSYDYGARSYDPRLGRWSTIDPQFKSQPGQTPYKAFLNSPLIYSDIEGNTEYQINVINNEKTGKSVVYITSNEKIITDAIPHSATKYQLGGDYNVVAFYDYATINIVTVKANGDVERSTSTEILYENGVKDTDVQWGQADAGDVKPDYGSIYKSWLTDDDKGTAVSFGIDFGSSGEGGSVGKDWSANAITSGMSLDILKTIMKSSAGGLKGTNYKTGDGSWLKAPKNAKDWISWVKNKFDGGEKVVETVNKVKEEFSPSTGDTTQCDTEGGCGELHVGDNIGVKPPASKKVTDYPKK